MDSEIFKRYISEKKLGDLELINLRDIKIDSRKIESGDIFLAIKGEKNDGNDFAEDVFSKGASLIITDRKDIKELYNEKAVLVKDSLLFLQEFSSFYRQQMNVMVIGITGSNGKTTTKDFLASILRRCGKTKKTIGNLNNHIGVPLTLLQLEKTDKYIVVEMGMSGFGEIDFLCKLAKPDFGIITNIGDSHMEFMKTRENVCKAKTEMLKYVEGKIVLNGDDEYLSKLNGYFAGFGDNCNVKGVNLKINENGSLFSITTEEKTLQADIKIAGEHNVLDALLAAACAMKIGIPDEDIIKGLKEADFTKMRFEKIEKGETIYINDAYNASPVSMKYSIETFSDLYNNGYEKIAVLGDMLELGEQSREYHEGLAEIINTAKIDKIYLYGNEMKYLFNRLSGIKEVKHFSDKREITNEIMGNNLKKAILLKGSRGMKLEDVII